MSTVKVKYTQCDALQFKKKNISWNLILIITLPIMNEYYE